LINNQQDETSEASWPEGTIIGIAQPLTWPYIHSYTYLSILAMDKPDIIVLDTPRSGGLAEKREAQTKAALQLGCSHIAYLDGDMIFPKTSLFDMMKVLQDGADLASIVCYRGAPPWDPLIWGGPNDELLKPFEDYKFGDLVDATAVGCGCLLAKREVFDVVPSPWFQVCEVREGKKVIRRGEDTYFTRKCTNAGLSLKVITAYDIGHLRDISIDRDVFLMGQVLKKFGSLEAVIRFLKLNNFAERSEAEEE